MTNRIINILISFFYGLGRGLARTIRAAGQQRTSGNVSRRVYLSIEDLECRLTPSVTWWMSGSTLKMADDAASDWMSVQITGDGRVWFNGSGMPSAQSLPVSQVTAIDIAGGVGNDNINVLQTAPFVNKPIRITAMTAPTRSTWTCVPMAVPVLSRWR